MKKIVTQKKLDKPDNTKQTAKALVNLAEYVGEDEKKMKIMTMLLQECNSLGINIK
jgi:hypothetical protein